MAKGEERSQTKMEVYDVGWSKNQRWDSRENLHTIK